MTAPALRVAMVAGEISGDLLGGLLLDGVLQRWPDAQTYGIGGAQMQRRGFTAHWPSDKLAVRGYVEVLRHYREIVGIRKQLATELLANPPDVFVGIDAPDFNLDLEAQLKVRGIKTVHFISPSIWAWRAERIEKIRRACDHVLCIFPFEKSFYDQAGIGATYVGHPLAQVIPMQPDKAAARAALGLAEQDTVVAVLPGSRRSEIQYLCSRLFKAVSLINRAQAAIKFIVPAIPGLQQQITAVAQEEGVLGKVRIFSGCSHTALAACDVTLIASGTATLEAALFKRPMVIAYNMHWASWQLMKRKKLQPWVGLPNILCREFVVPEFLQDAATPQALAQAVLDWLAQPEKIRALEQRFTALHTQLQRDTALLACNAIDHVLHQNTP
jgi:lipid-A-disaccharide synthase